MNSNSSRGVHLEAVGVSKWRLSGPAAVVHLERVEFKDFTMKWEVRNGGVVGSYSSAANALAHAYQIARGDSSQQAMRY